MGQDVEFSKSFLGRFNAGVRSFMARPILGALALTGSALTNLTTGVQGDHGERGAKIEHVGEGIVINGDRIRVAPLAEKDVAAASALVRQQLPELHAKLAEIGQDAETCFKHSLNRKSPEALAWAQQTGIILDSLQYHCTLDEKDKFRV